MYRTAIALALLGLAGCQGSAPMVSPFAPYGPTQVPPPPTGSAGRDPYYRRAAAGGQAPAAFSQAPASRPLARYTSDDEGSAAQMADRRAGLNDGASVSPGATGVTELDWRSPESSAAGSLPPLAPPRPQFPATVYAQAPAPATNYSSAATPARLDPRMQQAAAEIPLPTASQTLDNSGWSAAVGSGVSPASAGYNAVRRP